MKLTVLDTETSGLKPPVGVCEIGIIELDPVTLSEVSRNHSLVDPEVPISPGASGVHRITNSMVVNEPTLEEYFLQVRGDPYGDQDVIMVAHNASFDYPLVKHYLGRSRPLCTLKLARKVWKDAENHKLATLKFMLGLGRNDSLSHNALDDVEDTADLLRRIVQETGLTIPELLELQEEPNVIETMPFSKHKGEKLCDVPLSFWRWLMRQPGEGHDRDLVHSVRLLHPTIILKERP